MIEIEINKDNLELFLKNIRNEDRQELIYFLGSDYKNTFIDIVLNNKIDTYFLSFKGIPSCIGGIYYDDIGAQIWLLCAKSYDRKYLYKYIKDKITLFKQKDILLYNYIYKTNFKALKWLSHFGFVARDTDNSNLKFFYYKRRQC